MGAGDGQVLGMHPLNVTGPRNTKFNLALVPDGYQAGDMDTWANDAVHWINVFESTPPFDDPLLRSKINYFRVDVTSTDRGADKPAACFGDAATTARTFFDGTYCHDGQQRLLTVDDASVRAVLDAQVTDWTQALVFVNDAEHGGSGGRIPVSAKGPGWEKTAIHELGHAVFGLADEYEYYAGCGVDTDRNRYTGIEPLAPNVTIDSNRTTIEWSDLVEASTAMPTTANADCSVCDPQANPVSAGTVGAFEGAGFFHCGLYRPQFDCMMRNSTAFCAVCTHAIRHTWRRYWGVPRLVHVSSPAINFFFDPDGSVTAEDFAPSFVPIGATGEARLQTGMLPRAPAGVPGATLFSYEYRFDLRGSSGGTPGSCVHQFTLDFGPMVPLNYDGTGLSNAYVVTEGGIGSVGPFFVEQEGDRTIFTFDQRVCPGESSFFFGAASRYPPRDVTAQVRDSAGNLISVPAKAPALPPLPPP